MLLRGQPGSILGTHRHYDEVYGYTLKGAWGYYDHPEWLSKVGDERPVSVHRLYTTCPRVTESRFFTSSPKYFNNYMSVELDCFQRIYKLDSPTHRTSFIRFRPCFTS
jgi:hypothetical protein